MAGAIVHDKFFKDCIKNSSLNLNNNCSIYAQGHDLLLYIEPWNFSNNRQISLLLSNYKFQEFVYNYLKNAIRNKTIYLSKDVELFIYGFISHHILDAYFHPFIMQYCHDYLPVRNKMWLHGIIETLYDSFFIKKYYNCNPEKFKFYKCFEYKNLKNLYLIENINYAGLRTYNIKMLGKKFSRSFYSLKNYMHLYRYDPYSLKKSLGKIYDKITYIGAEYFFYRNDNLIELNKYNNINNWEWVNYWTGNSDNKITSKDGFDELYEKAHFKTCEIFRDLDCLIKNRKVDFGEIADIIPDISAITGLKCGINLPFIKNKEGLL